MLYLENKGMSNNQQKAISTTALAKKYNITSKEMFVRLLKHGIQAY